MLLDQPTFYLFVRTDISRAQQTVQTNHATFKMAKRLTEPAVDDPYIVLIEVADKTELLTVMERLERYKIGYECFEEPDNAMGLSAIATTPHLSKKQRRMLKTYKIAKEEVETQA